jgi:hypothetical protein
LLLDESLSEHLLHLIGGSFLDCGHLRLLGLGGADDLMLGERACSEDELLVI